MSVAPLSEQALACPNQIHQDVGKTRTCGEALYVRHTEGGTMDQVRGVHYVTTITWQAECHSCKWESPKRSTQWALIRTVQERFAGIPTTD